jgi:hypothetical protein
MAKDVAIATTAANLVNFMLCHSWFVAIRRSDAVPGLILVA